MDSIRRLFKTRIAAPVLFLLIALSVSVGALAEFYETVRTNMLVLGSITIASGKSFIVKSGAYKATVSSATLTANRTLTLPDETGTVLTSAGGTPITGSLIFEGATADDYETTIAVTDPTADRTITIPNVTGTMVTTGDTSSVTAGMISNPTRSIPLPLHAWVPCADGVWDSSGADAEPDLVAAPASTLAIVYDDTGGSVDTGTICTTFTVPADYASGGSFVARVTQDAATATQTETWSCAISVDGAALGSANAANLTNQTAVQSATSTPTGTWAAGASIQVACSQGNASADDTVNIHSIEAQYTATQ